MNDFFSDFIPDEMIELSFHDEPYDENFDYDDYTFEDAMIDDIIWWENEYA